LGRAQEWAGGWKCHGPVDANGNLTQKSDNGHVWAYEWNAENQLTRVTKDSAEVATFAYDPLGRRVEKAAGAVTTSFAYDGEDILRETRTGGTVFKYVHGPGIDEPLGREDQTAALNYYHVDGLGSVLKRSNQAASTVHEYRYDAWGNIESGASEAGYSFTGREWDSETGLHYYRARYYDPHLGRFISEDPIGLGGGGNYYRYVGNNPSTWLDPLGLYRCYYYIANHTLVCEPDDPTNPWFVTDEVTSGKNEGEEASRGYSECDDCQDNPRRTNRSGRGPIPEGTYNVGPMGSDTAHPEWRFLSPNPIPRTGFYTHFCGRNRRTCSEGCVAFTKRADFDEFNRVMNLEPTNTMTVRQGGGKHTRCGCQ